MLPSPATGRAERPVAAVVVFAAGDGGLASVGRPTLGRFNRPGRRYARRFVDIIDERLTGLASSQR